MSKKITNTQMPHIAVRLGAPPKQTRSNGWIVAPKTGPHLIPSLLPMHAVSFLIAEVHGQDPNMLTNDLSLKVENFSFVCLFLLSSCFPFCIFKLLFAILLRFCPILLFNLV